MATATPNVQPGGHTKLAQLMSSGVIPTFKKFTEVQTRSLMKLPTDIVLLNLEMEGIEEAKQTAIASGTSIDMLTKQEDDIFDRVRLKLNIYSRITYRLT